MNHKLNPTSGDDSELFDRARIALERMAKITCDAGISVLPYRSPELTVFRAHPAQDQVMLVREIEDRVDLFSSAIADGISPRDTRQMLWRSLRKAGWVPNSDVFDSIDETDTVEVYSLEMKQIFRNLEFFRWVSYTLEEVHGGTWYNMVARDPAAQAQLMQAALSVIHGKVTRTLDVSYIPAHICYETTSEERRQFMLQMKVLSPVYSDGVMSAVIAVNRTTTV